MKDTDILFSIALMILGIVLMYKSMNCLLYTSDAADE